MDVVDDVVDDDDDDEYDGPAQVPNYAVRMLCVCCAFRKRTYRWRQCAKLHYVLQLVHLIPMSSPTKLTKTRGLAIGSQ